MVEEEHVPQSVHPRATRRALLAVSAALLIGGALPLGAGAVTPQSGFKTKQAPMLVPGSDAPLGVEIKALMTVGDTIGGYRFESIPDGVAYWQSGKNEATVLVNHETSTVPFPYGFGAPPTTSNAANDFDNSQLSELVIRNGGQILSAEMVIGSDAGYQRFCSNFLATSDGFEDMNLLFTNEEGIDWIYEDPITLNGRTVSWNNETSLEGADGARQIGAVVAYNPATGDHKPIWGMGRHNHENTVLIPGYGYPVLLSGDDAFNQNAAQSQLYSYIAEGGDAEDVWNDEGTLFAFVADDPSYNDYYDFGVGSTAEVSGKFIAVPKEIATGKAGPTFDGPDLLASEVSVENGGPFDPPPAGVFPPSSSNPPRWQLRPGATSGPGVDGPQWILEHWGDGEGVFQFLRIEDIAYDKRPGMSNVVYLADSGRASATAAPGAPFPSTNGRVWKMVLNPDDPTDVLSLSILIEGEDAVLKTHGEIHQPDNLETTVNGLYITEDPSSGNAFTLAQQSSDAARATTARVWQYRFSGPTSTNGSLAQVLKVNQLADEGPTDVDESTTAGRWGDWEASGIIDVSSVFGPGKFLVTVQAHTLFIEIDNDDAPDNLGPAGSDWQYKREGGQLLLVTIPGG